MSDKHSNLAEVDFRGKDSSSADVLLKMLDKINDRARDLTSMFIEQGILPEDNTNNFRIVSHKMMKKRIKLMYREDNDQM